MKSVAFFNNKGGVGKTTLSANVAHYFATQLGKKVLIIDLDPQCNTTQLILDKDLCAELYWTDKAQASDPSYETVYDIVRPLEEGEATPKLINHIQPSNNRFKVALIPGHPRMSVMEDLLGAWFRETTSGEIGGIRKTLWLKTFLADLSEQFDFAFFDLGPSLGALNRSVLAASNYFLTPMGADIFSIVALRNIGEWIDRWVRLYEQGINLCYENNPEAAQKYNPEVKLPISNGFIGYTVQQYSTVTIRGERRATIAFENIINRIPQQVEEHLAHLSPDSLRNSALKLGDIPNLRSLVPLAQAVNAPLADLSGKDGLAGGQYSQQKTYVEYIGAVAQTLAQNLGVDSGQLAK